MSRLQASRRRAGPEIEALLVVALLAAPFLSPLAALLVATATGGLWVMRLRPGREQWVPGFCLAAALAGLLAGVVESGRTVEGEALVAWAGDSWQALWEELDSVAERGAESAGTTTAAGAALAATFDALSAVAATSRIDGASLLLLDADDEPVAWAGTGLLHDVPPEVLPGEGRSHVVGAGAATLLSVRPLGEGERAGRLVAGTSLTFDHLPFPDASRRLAGPHPWSVSAPGAEPAPGAVAVSLLGTPTLIIGTRPERALDLTPGQPPRWSRMAWGWIGLALVLSGAIGRYRRPSRAAGSGVGREIGLGLAGLVAWMLALALPAMLGLAALAALCVCYLVAVADVGARRPKLAPALGAAAVLVPVAGAWAAQSILGPVDLGSRLLGPPADSALRLLQLLVALAPLIYLARKGSSDDPSSSDAGWVWAAGLGLLAAAVFHDQPSAGLSLLVTSGALVGGALARQGSRGRAGRVVALLALAAWIGAVSWDLVYRQELRQELVRDRLPAMAPPDQGELARAARAVERSLIALDLQEISLSDPGRLAGGDLAFELWRRTPLARAGTLSALVVIPYDGGPVSDFAFGLPLTAAGEIDRSPASWEAEPLPGWDGALVGGEMEIMAGDEIWGVARYWQSLRPGFRLADSAPRGGLAAALVRGGPAAEGPTQGLVAPAEFALYAASGRALTSPWREGPPLDPAVRVPGQSRVDTPDGPSVALAATGEEGVRVLYLVALTALPAIERAGNFFVGVLSILAGAAAVLLFALVPLSRLREILARNFRSYSKRLLVVYAALLMVPLLLLSALFLRVLGDRIDDEQRVAGQAALESAQRVVGEYVLALEPGFGIDTALDDELLDWLSRVVHREVNLYWGSSIWATSNRQLFAAGLLPLRIPGEVYSKVALRDHGIASRVNRAGSVEYLELYAPLRVPGVPAGESSLFLSMPLLAQQEEVAAEQSALRRQALIVTTLVVLLLAAAGSRLGRSFTEPLEEIVTGTQRIAAGASSLDLAPSELELERLVEAIDRMATRIAEGRRSLQREKGVMERMVESITSGVVSLDREGRVLLHNRVARDLLGVEAGRSLESALQGDRPTGDRDTERASGETVLEFVAAARSAGPSQTTVRLGRGDEGEKEWSLTWVPLPGEGEPAALLVVEDVTEVLRGQRLEAWAEMARMIAHEVKNPLTPIRLSAEHLRQVHATGGPNFEEVLERCTNNILRQVEELRHISGEFSTYSDLLELDAVRGDLVVAVREVVDSYRTAPPRGIALHLLAAPDEILITFDSRLVRRAVRNLIANALRASPDGGHLTVSVGAAAGWARIVVADEGHGVEPESLGRIFDPYFSTEDAGTGLGLPIARRIAEAHGGRVEAHNRSEGGLEVTISLPA